MSIVLDKTGGTGPAYRMNAIDVHTGLRTRRVFTDGTSFKVIGHDAKHMWTSYLHYDLFTSGSVTEVIAARSPQDLSVLMDQAAIEKRNPNIVQGIRSRYSTFDTATGGLRVQSRYGDPFLIDGDTFKATPVPPVASSTAVAPELDAQDRVKLPDGSSLSLNMSNAHLEYVTADGVSTPVQPKQTYPRGMFVIDRCASTAATHESTYFIVWQKTRGDFTTSAVTRITPAGDSQWTADVQTAEPQNGRVINGLLIIVMSQANYVVALDVKTGEQRWRYDL